MPFSFESLLPLQFTKASGDVPGAFSCPEPSGTNNCKSCPCCPEATADEFENAKLRGRIYIELNKPMVGIPKLQALAGKDIDGSLHEILGRAYQALHQPNPAGLALRRATELRKRYDAEMGLEIGPPTK